MRSLRGPVVLSPMVRLCSFGDRFTVAHGWGWSATFVITKIGRDTRVPDGLYVGCHWIY